MCGCLCFGGGIGSASPLLLPICRSVFDFNHPVRPLFLGERRRVTHKVDEGVFVVVEVLVEAVGQQRDGVLPVPEQHLQAGVEGPRGPRGPRGQSDDNTAGRYDRRVARKMTGQGQAGLIDSPPGRGGPRARFRAPRGSAPGRSAAARARPSSTGVMQAGRQAGRWGDVMRNIGCAIRLNMPAPIPSTRPLECFEG